MINLFWRGLKGVPSDRDAAEVAAGPELAKGSG